MAITKDPFYAVIAGVGGQGNILLSRLLGRAFLRNGYSVTIVDTYGAAQRGGAVNTNLRISKTKSYETLVPMGQAHLILSLEPLETLRVLAKYGNPEVLTLTNFHPIPPLDVLSGKTAYPNNDQLKQTIAALSRRAWFVDASNAALLLGSLIMTNVVMLGALFAAELVPLTRQAVENEIRNQFPPDRAALNLKAFDMGCNIALESV